MGDRHGSPFDLVRLPFNHLELSLRVEQPPSQIGLQQLLCRPHRLDLSDLTFGGQDPRLLEEIDTPRGLAAQLATQFARVDTLDESDTTFVDAQDELAPGPSETRRTTLQTPDPLPKLPDLLGVTHGFRVLYPAVSCKAAEVLRSPTRDGFPGRRWNYHPGLTHKRLTSTITLPTVSRSGG